MIIAVDRGCNEVKVVTDKGYFKFNSAVCTWRQRDIEEVWPMSGEFEFEGEKGFFGDLAEIESEGSCKTFERNKNNFESRIGTLLAVAMCVDKPFQEIYLITANPLKTLRDNKQDMIDSFIGTHSLSLNGKPISFTIKECQIVAEGGAAYWSIRHKNEKVRVVDIGSSTVHCITMLKNRLVDKESEMLPFGMKTGKGSGEADYSVISKDIYNYMSKKWLATDEVLLCGGVADRILESFTSHYPNTRLLNPVFKGAEINPIYSNAVGLFNIAKALYKNV